MACEAIDHSKWVGAFIARIAPCTQRAVCSALVWGLRWGRFGCRPRALESGFTSLLAWDHYYYGCGCFEIFSTAGIGVFQMEMLLWIMSSIKNGSKFWREGMDISFFRCRQVKVSVRFLRQQAAGFFLWIYSDSVLCTWSMLQAGDRPTFPSGHVAVVGGYFNLQSGIDLCVLKPPHEQLRVNFASKCISDGLLLLSW